MMRSGNAVSSQNNLIPSESVYEKSRGIASADCEKEEFD